MVIGFVCWNDFVYHSNGRFCTVHHQPYSSNVSQLLFESAFELSFLFSGIFILTGAYNGLRSMSYIPRSFYSSIPPVLLLILAISLYSFSPPEEPSSRPKTTGRRLPRYLSFILYIIFMVIILLGSFPSIISAPLLKSSHPIDGLMHGASKQHDRWSKQAFTSRDLNDAAREYVRRYNRVPPPGFREWYEFSVAKNSSVIDDFDSIHENLLPFWALAPKTIRGRVKYIVDDRWNECAVVKIRSGAADLRNVQDTHRWMMEGIIRMMDPFIKHLPDMNIPFNVNDESRVAVPYDILDRLRKEAIARKVKDPKTEYFSNDRARQWNTTEPEPVNVEDASFKRNFRKFGSISCPPSSFARQYHAWDPATLCTDCIGPHSDGIFLKNWTLAASPCHQPDLANLHGFYISPSAFKTVRDLVPIFSQSRPHGYSDILYPSAWNYNDKVKYAPSDEYPDLPFEEKKNTLFWRGTTTEGYSNHAEWRGMVRQRLVHLANNSTIPSPILLPSPSDPSKLSYQSLLSHQLPTHPSLVHSNLSLSLGFVSEMVRCETAVCVAEELEFGLRPGNDFQYHWSNRYLMDVDGAGFSGRFLPFLQSHSLPFKSALFREWYDDRLVAWKHFVPVDLRLHGLWSTLAYFAGNFRVAKKEILKDASATEAARAKAGSPDPGEAIAEAGREWANKVLRKEDMEIYFFRLLLEWGRLTDDRRDDIGFIM